VDEPQTSKTGVRYRRPQWLEDAHRTLNKAALAAYGWPEDIRDTEILERLLALNCQRLNWRCSHGF
jgi:hypothetical protein